MFSNLTFGRRSILKMMAGFLPLTAARKGDPPTCEERLAVQAMRFVNTAQLWHKSAFGTYLDAEELGHSQVIARVREDPRLEKAGIGKSLMASINLHDDEIFDGWFLRLRATSSGGKGEPSYLSLIGPRPGREGRAFVSNQKGVIYEGFLRGSAYPRYLPVSIASMDWEKLAPIGQLAGAGGWFGTIASALLASYQASCETPESCFGCSGCRCDCEFSYPICCCCYFGGQFACLGSYRDGCCNTGCAGCTWCCCI